MAINLTQGAARERIDPAEAPELRQRGVLVEDARRERPRYFDEREKQNNATANTIAAPWIVR